MKPDPSRIPSALVADRHPGLSEGIRELLRSRFGAVAVVADVDSLLEIGRRLQPDVAVADLSLGEAGQEGWSWVRRLREGCPGTRLVLLTVHDEVSVRRTILASGADDVVLKRTLATDLMAAVERGGPDAGVLPGAGTGSGPVYVDHVDSP